MTDQSRQTLFSFDCGASNWRLFRTEYQVRGERAEVIAAPRPAPLSGFVDRRLPAAVLLAPAGDALERFGADAERALAGEATRSRVREYFRPSIGAHLVSKPLPHQRRYTHAEALQTTRMLLLAVLVQLRREALGGAAFDDRVRFAFAYPVQWRYEHGGRAFEDFRRTVLSCFPADLAGQVRFVAEPDGAFLGLRRQGMLAGGPEGAVTLIVDVGGSTTDVIAGRVDAGTGAMRFLGSYGAPFGGGLYDAEIAPLIADTLRIPASSLVHDAGAMTALRAAGQRIKEALSWQMAQSDAPGPPPRRSIELALRDGEARRGVIELDTATFHAATGHLTTGFDRLMAAATRSIGVEDWEIGRVLAIGAGVQLFVLVDHLRQRFGSRVVFATISVTLLITLVALAFVLETMTGAPGADDALLVVVLYGLAAAIFSAGIASLYALMTHAYPSSCRSAGIGFGIFVGRIGAISATGLGGWLIDLGKGSLVPFFAVLAISAVLMSAAAFVVDRHVPPARLGRG